MSCLVGLKYVNDEEPKVKVELFLTFLCTFFILLFLASITDDMEESLPASEYEGLVGVLHLVGNKI